MRDADRIFRALRSPWLLVRWCPLEAADGEWYGTVLLAPSPLDGDATLDTLVHETLHALNPEKSEAWVRRRTKAVMKSLTDRERKRLSRFLADVR